MSSPQQPNPSGAKRILFMLLTAAFPVLALVVVELLLRVFSYGPDLSLFVEETPDNKPLWVMNQGVKARYFSVVDFNPTMSNDFFQNPKPAGTYRIFCLGGSTTIGFPYGQAGSFPSFLRERLAASLPERKIEVINLGMTATNSYTVNDVVSELGDFSPDLLVVYDGHNEFYGALGSASLESVSASRWITRVYLKLVHLKLFHLVRQTVAWIGSALSSAPEPVPGTTLMETLARDQFIPYHDPLYAATLENFRKNLAELSSLARTLEVPLVLCTQTSNLRDLPPFVSAFTPGLSSHARARYDSLIQTALQHWRRSAPALSLTLLQSAAAIDSLRADLQYSIALCLDSTGAKHEALQHYVCARDYDQLRFRASSDFNEVIRAASGTPGVIVVDVDRAFMAASADSLIGRSLILEHLHPTLSGNFLIAKEIAEKLRANGVVAPSDRWQMFGALDEDSLFRSHPITEIDTRAAARRLEKLLSVWPFKEAVIQEDTSAQLDSLERIVDRFISGQLSWEESHVAAAEYYRAQGDLKSAALEYRALLRQFPSNVTAWLRYAESCLAGGDFEEGRRALQASLDASPTSYALRKLGILELNAKRNSSAEAYLRRAFDISGTSNDRVQSGYLLALALVRSGQADRAVPVLEDVLRLDPEHQESMNLLEFARRKGREKP